MMYKANRTVISMQNFRMSNLVVSMVTGRL
jgi:hypothetical protein